MINLIAVQWWWFGKTCDLPCTDSVHYSLLRSTMGPLILSDPQSPWQPLVALVALAAQFWHCVERDMAGVDFASRVNKLPRVGGLLRRHSCVTNVSMCFNMFQSFQSATVAISFLITGAARLGERAQNVPQAVHSYQSTADAFLLLFY